MASANGANRDLLSLIVGHEHFDDMCDTYRHLTEQDKAEILKIADAI